MCNDHLFFVFLDDFWLPSELPQVTPKTPHDHQQMLTNDLEMTRNYPNDHQTCSNNVTKLEKMHEYSLDIYGLMMDNP